MKGSFLCVRWTLQVDGEVVESSSTESPEVGCGAQMRFQSQRQSVDSAGRKYLRKEHEQMRELP